MDQPALPLLISPIARRRGRPPGARNRASLDLAKYVAATYGGMTPGQQAAALCLVSPKDMRQAKAKARAMQQLGLLGAHMPEDLMTLAMVVKAAELGLALGCDKTSAWALMVKEREGLMPYIHAKQAPAPPAKDLGAPATVYMVPEGAETSPQQLQLLDDDDIEFVDDLPGVDGQVSQSKSHDDT